MLARSQLWNALSTVAFAIRLPVRGTAMLTAHIDTSKERTQLAVCSGLLVSTRYCQTHLQKDIAEHRLQQLL